MYKEINFDLVNEYFYYDENSISKLSWKVFNGSRNPSTQRYPGDHAGSICKIRDNHITWQVKLKGKTYYVHRIVYVLKNRTIDESKVINHIDCNPSNNEINNLEICSIEQNNQRTKILTTNKLMITNTSGETGLVEEIQTQKNGNTYGYVRAFASINGRLRSKKFSYLKYGKEVAWKMAKEARNNFLNIRTKK